MTEKFNEKTYKEMEESIDDINYGRNLSPRMSSVEEARAWLEQTFD